VYKYHIFKNPFIDSGASLAKTFDIQQGKDEGPADFLHRLKDQMRKYSGLNLNNPWDREY
jgi:hypothetical protein